MACSIERQKQIVEAAKVEYKRLAALRDQGYDSDLENDIYDIEEAMNNMRAVVYKKPENIVESEVTPIDEMFINDLNSNNPKDGKANIKVLSGVRTASGKLIYTVQYPNNEKEYKLPASRITADQVSANAWYGTTKFTVPITEEAYNREQKVIETRQMAAKLEDERASKLNDKAAWKKYTDSAPKGLKGYARYSGALGKVIEELTSPKIVTDVAGLMLSEVHKDNIVVGEYSSKTHTLQIAKEPTKEEIADAAETVLVQLYINANQNYLNEDNLLKFVSENKLKALLRIIDTVEKVRGSHVLTHELIHAGSVKFMENNPNHPAVKRVKELYNEAISKKDDIQNLINGETILKERWQADEFEFVAEALSNPGLMNALSQVETNNKGKLSNMIKDLMDSLLDMLGLSNKVKNNLLEYTMDGFAAIIEAQSDKNTLMTDKVRDLVKKYKQISTSNTGRVYDMLVKEAGSEAALNGADVSKYSKLMKDVILKLVNPTVSNDPKLTAKAIQAIINNMTVTAGQYSPRDNTIKLLETNEVTGKIAETLFNSEYTKYDDIKKELMNTNVYAKRVEFVETELKKYTNDHTILHELVHAGSVEFMRNNPKHAATKRVQEIFELAKKEIDDVSDINFGYWRTNEYEFLAEALSNPKMIRELMSIKPDKKYSKLSNLFESLIDTLLGLLGLEKTKKESVFEYLLDGYFSMVENQLIKENPKNIKLAKEIKKEADRLVKGSDQNTGIGETDSDVFLGQEELELGQVLADEFAAYYEADVQEGRQIQTQEFADLQNYIVDTYQQTMQNLGTGNVKLRMFESLTEQTAGQIDLRTNEMHIRWNKMSRLARVSEVFLHEINHSMSHHVFKENIKLRRLMEDLRDSALKSGVDYKLFLEGLQNPTAEEVEIAKMKFEYTFDKTANVEEFYAYATTNENVYNAVKDIEITSGLFKELELNPKNREPFKKVLNILIKEINRLWRLLSGRGDTGGKIIVDMISTIAKLDAEMAQKKSQADNSGLGISDYAKGKISALDEALEPVVKKVSDWNDKLSAKQSASWLGEIIRKIPVLNELLETGVSQYLWRMVTQDTTSNDVADMYMIFRHSKQVVEKHTSDIRNGVKAVVTDLYKDIDTPTKNAVTRILLEADLAQFDAETIKNLLEDPKNIDKEINKLKAELEIKPNSDMLKQIEGLAEYLVIGKTVNHNQQINANNIVVGLYKEQRKYKPANKNKVKLVDKLVSLIALKNSDSVQVELLKNVDNEILDKTINMYRGYMDSMRVNATIDAHDPIPKGYTRPEDGLIKYELIPEEEVKAQESVLMKLVNEKPYAVVEGKKYYLMTGRTKSVGFTEGAIGLISHTAEGIPLSSLIRKNNELKGKLELMDGELKRRTREIILSISRQEKGADKYFKLGEGQTLVPVYDHQNNLVDYRIQLNKLEKEVNLPDRKTELEDVLSHTFSRSIKTSLTATENKKVVDTILAHSAAGVLERPQDYVLVEEYTETDRLNGVKREKRHDRWEYLPDHTKDYIFQKTKNKGILIHKDFVELMTGEKDVTIGNFAKFGIDLRKYPVARARLMALESYLAEILGYVKNAMVVLNADVLLGNQTSNAMVAIAHGIDPIDYAKKFKTRWQQLNDYNEKLQQLAELEVRKMAGESVDNKIKQLNRQLEGNTWNELVKDGQYTALVEDINIESQGEGQLMTMAKNYLEKKNWLGAIDTVKNVLYINRTTSLYNSMLKTVHYGDAITRQIIKEELEKKAIARDGELKSEVEREILNYLDQLLVNYGYTMNRWWKYAERVGGLFFMKYYLSQAKAIMSMTKKNPTRMGLMQGAQQLTGMDVQDPIDTYLRSGIDGVAYRWMMNDAPEQILQPNILDLIPSLDSIVKIR